MPKTTKGGQPKTDELPGTLKRSNARAQRTFAKAHDAGPTNTVARSAPTASRMRRSNAVSKRSATVGCPRKEWTIGRAR